MSTGVRRPVCLSIVVSVLALSAAAAAPQTLAVLNFTNRNPDDGWDWLEKGLADMLITDLSASARLQVVSRERMQLLFEEMELQKKLQMKGAAQEFAKVVKVQYVLTGTFWAKDNRLTIQSQMVEANGGGLRRLVVVRASVFVATRLCSCVAVEHIDVQLLHLQSSEIRRITSFRTVVSTRACVPLNPGMSWT